MNSLQFTEFFPVVGGIMGMAFVMKEHRSHAFMISNSLKLCIEAVSRDGVLLTEATRRNAPYEEVGSSEIIVLCNRRTGASKL